MTISNLPLRWKTCLFFCLSLRYTVNRNMTFEQIISSSSDFRLSAGVHSQKKKKKKPEMKATVQSEALMHEQNERGCKAWVLSTTRWSITVCVGFKLPLRRRKQTLGPVAAWENRTTSRKMVHFTLAHTCLLWTKHSGSQPFFFSGTNAREL